MSVPTPMVDEVLAGIAAHQERQRVRQIVHGQEIALRRAAAPDHDFGIVATSPRF